MKEIEKMKQETEKLRHQLKEKDAKQISLAEDLECDDMTCADILHETGKCFSEIVTGVEPVLCGTKRPNCGCVIRLFQKSNIISQIF